MLEMIRRKNRTKQLRNFIFSCLCTHKHKIASQNLCLLACCAKWAVLSSRAKNVIWTAGFSCAEARSNGYKTDLKVAGYSVEEAKAAGCTIDEIKEAGYVEGVAAVGYTIGECFDAIFSCEEVRRAGFVEGIKAAGYSIKEAKLAGFRGRELRRAGFTCDDMFSMGFSCKEAKEAGWTAMEAKVAGYTLEQIRDAGYALKVPAGGAPAGGVPAGTRNFIEKLPEVGIEAGPVAAAAAPSAPRPPGRAAPPNFDRRSKNRLQQGKMPLREVLEC